MLHIKIRCCPCLDWVGPTTKSRNLNTQNQVSNNSKRNAIGVHGPNDPEVLGAIYNRGMAKYRLEQYEPAEKNLFRALLGWTKVYGPKHEATLDTLHWTCCAQHQLGLYDEAEVTCREALNQDSEVYGHARSSTLKNLMTIIDTVYRMGKHEKAKSLIELLMKMKRSQTTSTDKIIRKANELLRLINHESAAKSESAGSAGTGTAVKHQVERQRKAIEHELRNVRRI